MAITSASIPDHTIDHGPSPSPFRRKRRQNRLFAMLLRVYPVQHALSRDPSERHGKLETGAPRTPRRIRHWGCITVGYYTASERGNATSQEEPNAAMPLDAITIRQTIRALAQPALGALRYALTLAFFSGIWWYDARYLNWAFDLNLALIKSFTGVFDGSGKTEAMMRAFAAEKMLLFAEGSAVIWGTGRIVAECFRRLTKAPTTAAFGPAKQVPQPLAAFRRRPESR